MTCAVEGCTKPARTAGYCNGHYIKLRRYGDPLVSRLQRYDEGSMCVVDGCGTRPLAAGLCRPHYERKQRSGEPGGLYEQPLGRPLAERFWEKVDKQASGCWVWLGTKTRKIDGYGQIRVNGRLTVAHRVAYELIVGPIPPGLDIDHRCRNRVCVNPAHLEPVTRYVNNARGLSPVMANGRKTHCHRGHLLSGDNLRLVNGGRSRRCLACKRDNAHAYYERRKNGTVRNMEAPS